MLDGPAPPHDEDGTNGDDHHHHHHRTQHEEFLHLVRSRGLTTIKRKQRHLLNIKPEDFLIVVDLQEDFLPPNGLFKVGHGDEVVAPICELVEEFVSVGAYVYCSRDYHPSNHCSFDTHGGSFPRHCVQGTHGARFTEPLAQVMQHHLDPVNGPVFVVYKGFSPDVDSFGAVRYDDEILNRSPRVSRRADAPHCSSSWTGSFLLYSSNANELKATLDHLSAAATPTTAAEAATIVVGSSALPSSSTAATNEKAASSMTESAAQSPSTRAKGNLYVVGLALDYCVLDTAVNAASLKDAKDLFHSVTILVDYCRPAHVANIGPFGSGFFTDPIEFATQCRNKVELVTFQQSAAALAQAAVRATDNPLA
ncbi:isochorismatase hydrolase, putative [Bodo saltans]|uniref:nicotinamidase n=1 Tax=Bodo saltans TaxID=75058 RepID=A0A0S4J312_BODSA|nr:isochorismatase hydrolase, putative [Bodo saltans]|eukprot:CUG72539.1 isochorismatase hydrolase, putative [Bodo saltans]